MHGTVSECAITEVALPLSVLYKSNESRGTQAPPGKV
jgi:hypothetical protein